MPSRNKSQLRFLSFNNSYAIITMTNFHPELTLLSHQQRFHPMDLRVMHTRQVLEDLSAGLELPLDLSNLHNLAKEVLLKTIRINHHDVQSTRSTHTELEPNLTRHSKLCSSQAVIPVILTKAWMTSVINRQFSSTLKVSPKFQEPNSSSNTKDHHCTLGDK
jgi:hypothetical protein